jgi:hypothetical protein
MKDTLYNQNPMYAKQINNDVGEEEYTLFVNTFSDNFKFSGNRWVFSNADSTLLFIGENDEPFFSLTIWNIFDIDLNVFMEQTCVPFICVDDVKTTLKPSIYPSTKKPSYLPTISPSYSPTIASNITFYFSFLISACN